MHRTRRRADRIDARLARRWCGMHRTGRWLRAHRCRSVAAALMNRARRWADHVHARMAHRRPGVAAALMHRAWRRADHIHTRMAHRRPGVAAALMHRAWRRADHIHARMARRRLRDRRADEAVGLHGRRRLHGRCRELLLRPNLHRRAGPRPRTVRAGHDGANVRLRMRADDRRRVLALRAANIQSALMPAERTTFAALFSFVDDEFCKVGRRHRHRRGRR